MNTILEHHKSFESINTVTEQSYGSLVIKFKTRLGFQQILPFDDGVKKFTNFCLMHGLAYTKAPNNEYECINSEYSVTLKFI